MTLMLKYRSVSAKTCNNIGVKNSSLLYRQISSRFYGNQPIPAVIFVPCFSPDDSDLSPQVLSRETLWDNQCLRKRFLRGGHEVSRSSVAFWTRPDTRFSQPRASSILPCWTDIPQDRGLGRFQLLAEKNCHICMTPSIPPSRVQQMLRDTRNPMQWWTFGLLS